jgi:hypothetical protein
VGIVGSRISIHYSLAIATACFFALITSRLVRSPSRGVVS